MSALRALGILAVLTVISLPLAACDNDNSGTAKTAEATEIRFGRQIGLGYLSLYIMEEKKLVEKHAKAAGLGEVKVSYRPLGSPAVINDSLLSGNIDVGGAGMVPFLILYDKTKGSSTSVRALTSLSMQPFMLMSNRPGLKTFKDLTEQDRIAVPAVKTSMNAMFLSMAAEKYLGKDKIGFVDALQVAYSHPDAVISLISGQSSITAHMATLPFSVQEAMDPKIHRVMKSYDLTDGPASIMATYALESFYKKNPRLMKAVYAALKEASEFVEKNKAETAAIYIKADKSKLSQAMVEGILNDPDNSFGVTPQKTMFFAGWLYEHGLIKNKPTTWKDLFFEFAHELPGN